MRALPALHDLFTLPDPALRQPFTLAAFFPLILSYYAMAVLVILPHTFVLRLSLLPFLLSQAWRCAFRLDISVLSPRFKDGEPLNHFNSGYVIFVVVMAMRSIEWSLARKPFRRYEPFAEGQQTPIERPLTIPNVILDAFDLLCNHRGIRWSWGSKSFLRTLPPPQSLAAVCLKILFKLTVYDTAHYIIQRTRPSIDTPAGDTLFDPHLHPLPRAALAAFLTLCGGIDVYTGTEIAYHIATLIGRVLLRQPATDWPALSARPWMATSIADFWVFRWHQYFRHIFVTFGARPGGALFGRAGAVLGAFGVSAVLHCLGFWGLGRGMGACGDAVFFIFMGVGVVLEGVWQHTTGRRVSGFWGWAWTMAWTLTWGTFLIDGWARHGVIAGSDLEPNRPGKVIVESIIALFANK